MKTARQSKRMYMYAEAAGFMCRRRSRVVWTACPSHAKTFPPSARACLSQRRCLHAVFPPLVQGETVYYKSPTMHDVDDGIGDIQGKITDKQVQQCGGVV